MDNKVALGYLVKIGEGGALTLTIRTLLVSLSMGLSASKKITITAEYLPGHLNVTADWESGNFQDKSYWKLPPEVFAKICQKLGAPSIDLSHPGCLINSQPIWSGSQIREVR